MTEATTTNPVTVSTTKPDFTANIIREQDDKSIWDAFYTANNVKPGYSKGEDINGRTIIVETLAAKLEREGKQLSDNRLPELYIYVEIVEDGVKVWNQIAVAWKGKKDGVYTGKTSDGENIVIRTRAAIEALNVKQKPKQVKALDL